MLSPLVWASPVGAAVGLVMLLLCLGLVVAVAIPVTQGWRGLTWHGWRRLSARFSLEAGERETLQGCALARCVLRFAPTLPNDAALNFWGFRGEILGAIIPYALQKGHPPGTVQRRALNFFPRSSQS